MFSLKYYRTPVTNAREFIPTRESLLNRLKNWNDDKSWREFFDTYWLLIYTAAIKSGLTDPEAQEVVQETLIAVSKSMPTFTYDPAKGSFKGWLLNLTAWRIDDQRRKRPYRPNGSAHEAECPARLEAILDPLASDLERIWNEEWEQNILHIAVTRLKRKTQAKEYQIFDLCVFKEWPVLKVSRALRVNPARVYRAKHRISALLKREVGQVKSTTL
jgi:RNA polymerase sigma-70 factor (ECF subfamily)